MLNLIRKTLGNMLIDIGLMLLVDKQECAKARRALEKQAQLAPKGCAEP